MAVVNMKIVVGVRDSVDDFYPGPFGPGKRFIFSERLVLESINDNTNGVPQGEDARRAGTHAGIVTTLTENGTYQLQYEATFRLSALPFPPPHGLPAGQITARGILLQGGAPPAEKKIFAITGGTGAYVEARGQLTEEDEKRILDVRGVVV